MTKEEAIKRIKDWNLDDDDMEVLTAAIPELKESEDERIRKWIRKELESKYVVDNIVNNEMADKAFAWLEKQGEQKPIKEHNVCTFCKEKYGCVSPCPTKLIEEQKSADTHLSLRSVIGA